MMKSTSMLAALMGMAAMPLVSPDMPALAAYVPPGTSQSNRRPSGAHKAFVRAAKKARRVRAHRARA